mgnify:CR=1 FL=1
MSVLINKLSLSLKRVILADPILIHKADSFAIKNHRIFRVYPQIIILVKGYKPHPTINLKNDADELCPSTRYSNKKEIEMLFNFKGIRMYKRIFKFN